MMDSLKEEEEEMAVGGVNEGTEVNKGGLVDGVSRESDQGVGKSGHRER